MHLKFSNSHTAFFGAEIDASHLCMLVSVQFGEQEEDRNV